MKLCHWFVITLLLVTQSYNSISLPKKVMRLEKQLKYNYETDGHYWTVLVVATLLKIEHSKEIAFHAEYPDNVINSDGYCTRHRYTFMYPKAQKKIHALTGGNPQTEHEISKQMLKAASTSYEKGIAAHRLGDSYAHINDKTGRMYPHIIAHLFQWKKPDKIENHPSRYLDYVEQLIECWKGKNTAIDMTVFKYIVNAKLGSNENSAILKAEYNYLIGSLAFCVEKNEIAIVEKYLTERLAPLNREFTFYSNTNHKGRVTTVVIFGPKSFAKADRP